jgi:hypothetical protein
MDTMSCSAEAVAWVCFGLGVVILLAGVVIGLILGFAKVPKTDVSTKDANEKLAAALTHVGTLQKVGVDAAKESTTNEGKAEQATQAASAAESALKEVQGIISALPERLRFSGLLVLIGALLMSVATVQFGGHSIF